MDVNSIRRMIIQAKSLPTIPSTLYHIIECVNDENTSAKDLKEIILHDQSISAKVLNVANSAWFGFARKVEDISRSIVVLGFDTVLEIAMYVSFSTFIHEASRASSFDPEKFWIHSIASSESAKMISKELSVTTSEVAILIGLLHDIGKIMVNYLYPREYAEVLKKARNSKKRLDQIEMEMMGFDHTDIGSWLGEKWKLPPRLTACLKNHHRPADGDNIYRQEIHLAYIANNVAKSLSIGYSGNPHILSEPVKIKGGLSFTKDALQNWSECLAGEEERIKSLVFHMK